MRSSRPTWRMTVLAPLLIAALCCCDHPVDGPKIHRRGEQVMRERNSIRALTAAGRQQACIASGRRPSRAPPH